MKVLIIGGGAGGMMAALSALEDPRNTVTVLERQSRLGRKLLSTGNGRCNLTNLHLDEAHYHGRDPAFIRPALARFGGEQTLQFFRSLGLLTVSEPSGRVYPLSDQANSVLDVLRFALEQRGAQVVCGCEVMTVHKKARGYEAVSADGRKFFGDALIIACGGCAGGKLGGTGAGYALLRQLGHSCTELRPSLTYLTTEPEFVRALKGVRADAGLRLRRNGHTAAEAAGEVQFTETGVSGPAAFELSRAASCGEGGQELLMDFFRSYEDGELLQMLRKRRADFPGLPAQELLSGMLHPRLGKMLLRRALTEDGAPLEALSDAQLAEVLHTARCCVLRVTGVGSMDSAQVTAGGVPTCEFDPVTLESRLAPHVFAVGEVLDIDGDCGGYNLQWAWSSGYTAGKLGNGEQA